MMRRRNRPVTPPPPERPIPAEGLPLKLVDRKRLRDLFAAGPQASQCPTCGKCPTCGRPFDTPDQSDAEGQRHE